MNVAFESSFDRRGLTAGRWALAGLVMIGLHIGGAGAGYFYWDSAPTEMLAPPVTVIAFELAPVPVAPPPPPKAEEVPEIDPVLDPPPPITELELIPPAPPAVEVAVAVPEKPKPVKKKKKKKEAEKKKKPPVKPVEAPPQQVFKSASDEPSNTKVESPPQPNTLSAPVAAGPTPDEIARVGQATQAWEIAFYKHIKKYQRYPKSAKRKNQTGSPMVRFVFDRTGNVLDAQVVRSSGYEALDEEAIATFQRASPLPPLPPEIEGDRLARNIPVNFTLK